MRSIFKFITGIAAFLGLGPIAADVLKRWLERSGYLDRPDEGAAWLLSVCASLSHQWWFWPTLCLLSGFWLGLLTDGVMRFLGGAKEHRRDVLGSEMITMSYNLRHREMQSNWPLNCQDLRIDLDSLFIRSKREKIYAPDQRIFLTGKGQLALWEHLESVGKYLTLGHIRQARSRPEVRGIFGSRARLMVRSTGLKPA